MNNRISCADSLVQSCADIFRNQTMDPRPTVASVIQPADTRTPSPAGSIMFTLLPRLSSLWAILFAAVSLTVYWTVPELLWQSILIAVASGLISSAALLPSLQLGDSADAPAVAANKHFTAILVSMAIRVAGTVALFLFCRYQMGLPPGAIAAMVCGWYVLLTSFEVFLLARSMKLLTRSMESTSE